MRNSQFFCLRKVVISLTSVLLSFWVVVQNDLDFRCRILVLEINPIFFFFLFWVTMIFDEQDN